MDAGAIRILEDLIDLLVKKNIFMFTELPKDAQMKIQERRQLRQKIGKETIIVDDII
jgi:acyl-coenzyme A synthetase/AMP-(fatty) acid ligase